MRKICFLLILFVVAFSAVLTACNEKVTAKDHLPEIYIQAFDSFMPLDEGLNGEMKYIAIDMSNLNSLNITGKEKILNHFKKYGVEVMEASLEDLKQKGLFNERSLSLEGILLSIKEVDIQSDTKVQIEGSKYRSGLGAIGVITTVVYKDGKWQVEKANITWIS